MLQGAEVRGLLRLRHHVDGRGKILAEALIDLIRIGEVVGVFLVALQVVVNHVPQVQHLL
jgi:hypothetical protein